MRPVQDTVNWFGGTVTTAASPGRGSMLSRCKQLLAMALVLAVPAVALAAAPDKAEKVAAKMLELDKALQMANAQIDKTLTSMNAMSQPEGDLVAKYKTF